MLSRINTRTLFSIARHAPLKMGFPALRSRVSTDVTRTFGTLSARAPAFLATAPAVPAVLPVVRAFNTSASALPAAGLTPSASDPGVFYSPVISGPALELAQEPMFSRIAGHGYAPAISCGGRVFTYVDILSAAQTLREQIQSQFGISDAALAPGAEQPKLAILAQPSFEYVAATFAAWSLGCVAVPLHPAHPLAEMEYIVENSQAVGILAAASLGLRAAELLPTVAANAGATAPEDHARFAITLDDFKPAPGAGAAVAECARQLKAGKLSALRPPTLTTAAASPLPSPPAGSDAVFIYTSGTTGKPKGVRMRHESLTAQITAQVQTWGWAPSDCIANVLPLHHVHGFTNVVMTALWTGARLSFGDRAGRPGFNAAAQWADWEHGARAAPALAPHVAGGASGVSAAVCPSPRGLTDAEDAVFATKTLFMAVPTVYDRLLAAAPADAAAARAACAPFRLMVSGSMALPISTLERWRGASGHTLLERYGMTEIGMALTNPLDEGARRPGWVGKPFPGVETRLRITAPDDADAGADGARVGGSTDVASALAAAAAKVPAAGAEADAPVWGPGELLVRGPSVFKSYWRREDATREAFEVVAPAADSATASDSAAAETAASDEWFLTGDIVSVDAAGDFKILGRASVDILKVSGYKLSALDIERELLEHSGVAEVAVLGLPSETYGQTVAAVVVPTAAAAAAGGVTLRALRAWGKERMADYKLPRALWVCDEIPRNAMGKVNKKQLAKFADKFVFE